MGILDGTRRVVKLKSEHEAELKRLKDECATKIEVIQRQANKKVVEWRELAADISNEKTAQHGMFMSDIANLKRQLEEAKRKLEAQLSEKDRMEKLLTKVSKRSATYRTMMEAVAAWEEEIAIEREDDKLEKFLKWKNERKEKLT